MARVEKNIKKSDFFYLNRIYFIYFIFLIFFFFFFKSGI